MALDTAGVLDWVSDLDRLDRLGQYRRRLADTARRLAADGADGIEVAGLITTVNDALTVAVLRLAEARLGEPPGPYAWLVLGSGGRREQALLADQDHALVYPDHTEGQAYFTDLAATVVTALADAGFPPCPGGYMATTWQHSLHDWRRIFRAWIERPEPEAVVEAEVFLDFRRLHGTLSPAPLDAILRDAADHPRFLIHMARAALAFSPPLGLLGRVRLPRDDLDLKRGGITGLVLLARLYALAAGSVARPTLDRLAAAAAGGTLSHGGADRLALDYRFLTELRLRTQLRVAADGGEPSNRIRPRDLTAEEQRRLREALRDIRNLQRATALHFHADAVI